MNDSRDFQGLRPLYFIIELNLFLTNEKKKY